MTRNLVFALICSLSVLASCSSEDADQSSELNALTDLSMTVVNRDGSVSVTCRDQRNPDIFYQEHYRNLEQYRTAVANDSLCGREPAFVECVENQGRYYLTRTADNRTLSGALTWQECDQAAANAKMDLACIPSGFGAFLTKVSLGVTLGPSLDSHVCLAVVREAKNGLVCGKTGASYNIWQTDASYPFTIGEYTDLNKCNDMVKGSTPWLFCAPSSSRVTLRRTYDGRSISNFYFTPDECARMVNTSRDNYACVYTGPQSYKVMDVETMTTISGDAYGDLDSCVRELPRRRQR